MYSFKNKPHLAFNKFKFENSGTKGDPIILEVE